jgi:hypothetical protein
MRLLDFQVAIRLANAHMYKYPERAIQPTRAEE